MKSKLALSAVIVAALALGGCSALDNSLGKIGANFSKNPATVTCWSGGKVIYQTTTRGKVTTGAGDMATFWNAEGNLVEMFADCSFVYDLRPGIQAVPNAQRVN